MPGDRDEFPASVRRIVAERAGYLCTKPDCRRLTVGPHDVDGKSLTIGVAAHVAGASVGGPRFRADQTSEDRRSEGNAIWLCHSCSDLVDKDVVRFPEEVLLRWRSEHEEFIRAGGGYPALPQIVVRKQVGLSMPAPLPGTSVTTTGEDIQRYHQHELRLVNPNRRALHFFRGRIQFAELVVSAEWLDGLAGVDLRIEPEHMRMTSIGSPGTTATFYAGDGSSPNLILTIEPVPPGIPLRLLLTSRPHDERPHLPSDATWMDGLRFYLLAEFQYDWQAETIRRQFIVPLAWDQKGRRHVSGAAEEGTGSQPIVWSRFM